MPFLGIFDNPIGFLIGAALILVALTIHEFAHAITADRLGDPTPRLQGRVTLNPLAHLDPLGTIAMLLVGFGWGKPVIFDPYNLKDPKRDAAIIAAAGPISNILLAVILSIVFHSLPGDSGWLTLIAIAMRLNLNLAIFNLIPIHPLDGGKILIGLAPKDIAREWDQILHQYGTVLLLFLIIPFGGQSAVSSLITPIVNTIMGVLL